jgi:Holliday junction resolvase RusA-like endonuclease
MMSRLELNVPCTVVGMPRPRARAMKTKAGNYIAQVYQPKKGGRSKKDRAFVLAAEFKRAVEDAVWQSGRPAEPWEGPIRVEIQAYFERPQYMLKPKFPAGRIPHTAKPDRDNLDKAVLDALKGAGVFVDDAQVCAGEIEKWWVKKGGTPGVVVIIERMVPAAEPLLLEAARV